MEYKKSRGGAKQARDVRGGDYEDGGGEVSKYVEGWRWRWRGGGRGVVVEFSRGGEEREGKELEE
jgi:hypothetical protein